MSLRDLDDGLLEPERYELDEPPAYRFDLDRREFIAVLGAGILVSVSGSVGLAQERPGRNASATWPLTRPGFCGTRSVSRPD